MVLRKNRISLNLYFWIIFLSFIGYYSVLVLIFNLGFQEATRSITIPIRLLISSLLLALLVINFKNLIGIWESKLYFIFLCFVLLRTYLDYIRNEPFYLEYTEFLYYFFSFSVLPFYILVRIPLNRLYINKLIKAISVSGLFFSIFVVWFYARFLGQVSRLSSGLVDENVLSPLILSYTSSLIIGVLVFYFLYNRTRFVHKIIGLSAIILSFIPFFLGASRGSLIGIFLPFLLIFYSDRRKYKQNILLLAFAIGVIIFLDGYFESGLLDRFLGISKAVEQGDSSAIRLEIWKSSFDQFLRNPILGDRLEMDFSPGYAHNFFLEVLQTLGVLGFVPFLALILRAWKLTFFILRNNKEYFWVPVIFIQSFCQGMFSGTVYTAVWFWTSMAILFSFYHYLRNKDKGMRDVEYASRSY